MTLYSEIVAAGVPYSNHESDLYVQDSPVSREILSRFPLESRNATRFINQADPHKGELWIDIPFSYMPFWENRR
jgi:hypothetical protein